MLEALGDVAGARVLLATAEGARDVLEQGLRERGGEVTVLHLYRTESEPVDAEAVLGCDLVTFASSSTVVSVLLGLPPAVRHEVRAVSIGPVTTAALRECGVEPCIEASPHDVDGLVAAVLHVAGGEE
jgi:uroporphyrinogen III methyltransferase/synthase